MPVIGLQKCPCSVCKANPRSDRQTRANIRKHVQKDEARKCQVRLLEARKREALRAEMEGPEGFAEAPSAETSALRHKSVI